VPIDNSQTGNGRKTELLFRVVAPRFVAGLIVRDGRVVEAAPILRRHVMGLDGRKFAALCAHMGWTFDKVGSCKTR
jgi:hypothetical protein